MILSNTQAQNLFVVGCEGGFDKGYIVEVTPGGVRSTFAFGLSNYVGMAFNSAGDLFVAKCGANGFSNGTIIKITPGGVQSTFASGLETPVTLAFSSTGDLFVDSFWDGTILKITPGGVQSTFATGLTSPEGMAFDSAGNLFVADNGSGNIYKFTPGGARSTFASGLKFPDGVAIDSADDLFVVVAQNGSIVKITPGGVQSTFNSELYNIYNSLAFDSAGNLFAAEYGNGMGTNGTIFKITPDGVQSTFASGFYAPISLAFQPAPPVLRNIAQSNGVQFVIGVGGVLGQKIVLQSSPDLQNWLPLATNTLTSGSRNYTNNAPQNCSEQFYRALWLK